MSDGSLSRGAIIGDRFCLEAELGVGSAGSVWLAHDRLSGQMVALKRLHDVYRENPRILARFQREAKLLEKLAHENIPEAIAAGIDGEHVYIAMEYVRGTSLADEMRERSAAGRGYTLTEVELIMSPLFVAVAHAHGHGVIHRDLKPQNVVIDRLGPRPSVKVLDFGIAKILDDNPEDGTTIGRVFGTPQYMAPEQCLGERTDQRTDLFALGVMLYELFTLHKAWIDDGAGAPVWMHERRTMSLVELSERITRGPRLQPSTLRPELGESVDTFMESALSIEPSERFQTVAEFRDRFEELMAEQKTKTEPTPIETVPGRPPKRPEVHGLPSLLRTHIADTFITGTATANRSALGDELVARPGKKSVQLAIWQLAILLFAAVALGALLNRLLQSTDTSIEADVPADVIQDVPTVRVERRATDNEAHGAKLQAPPVEERQPKAGVSLRRSKPARREPDVQKSSMPDHAYASANAGVLALLAEADSRIAADATIEPTELLERAKNELRAVAEKCTRKEERDNILGCIVAADAQPGFHERVVKLKRCALSPCAPSP